MNNLKKMVLIDLVTRFNTMADVLATKQKATISFCDESEKITVTAYEVGDSTSITFEGKHRFEKAKIDIEKAINKL